ncbi:MAG: DUF134 domain-containing protein [Syntrophales bacterium]|nr:DUF134 domain-containing protein [Syntrophales bacterium]MDD5640736.1 DUF134 domain-containing protein [Syntrophales bacterium]
MARPKKCRWVKMEPGVTFFKPQGIPLRSVEHTVITIDEMEAMRLSDFLGLNQEEVAKQMQVSRPTVTRMLARAHKAVADALAHGKAIRIEGGDYRLVGKFLECRFCGHREAAPPQGGEDPHTCSNCQKEDFCKLSGDQDHS